MHRTDQSVKTSVGKVLTEVRDQGLGRAAEVIERRLAQVAAKMKLDPDQAMIAAQAVLAAARHAWFKSLLHEMPRSAVELARAVAERGVALDDAEEIARYLVMVGCVLDFARPDVFDENHSHVIGRYWQDIDYRGEGMTWQSQKAFWQPRGVTSFKRRGDIHAYFVGAERLPHWKRVYRPRGKMRDVGGSTGCPDRGAAHTDPER